MGQGQVLQSRLDCAARNPPLASHSASVVDRWAVSVPLPRDSLSYFVSYCDSVSSYCDSVSTTPAEGQVRANSAGTVQCVAVSSHGDQGERGLGVTGAQHDAYVLQAAFITGIGSVHGNAPRR